MLSGESVDQMRAVLQFLLAALESNAHFEILQAVLSVLLKARHRHPPVRNAGAHVRARSLLEATAAQLQWSLKFGMVAARCMGQRLGGARS